MKKQVIISTFLIILLIGALGFLFYKKRCSDEDCFNKALSDCSPSKYYGYRNNNLYYYGISRSFRGDCKLYIKVERMAIGSEPDLVRLMEEKSMKCNVPRSVIINLDNMENLLTYCHGELKEGLYQLMLERLYALVVRDMSGVISEAKKAMKI